MNNQEKKPSNPKTIYNVAVLMDSQEQCNRMKQLCLDNGLPMSTHKDDYKFVNNPIQKNCFRFSKQLKCFAIWWLDCFNILITEAEFIELLKQEKG